MGIDEIAQGNSIEEEEKKAQGRVLRIPIFERQVKEEGL